MEQVPLAHLSSIVNDILVVTGLTHGALAEIWDLHFLHIRVDVASIAPLQLRVAAHNEGCATRRPSRARAVGN